MWVQKLKRAFSESGDGPLLPSRFDDRDDLGKFEIAHLHVSERVLS
jgi:hypothetical protein